MHWLRIMSQVNGRKDGAGWVRARGGLDLVSGCGFG